MLDPTDPRPPYLQIVEYVSQQIATGALRPGDKLPGRKAYQEQFKVAGATVNRAIDVLKNVGVLVGRQGQGVFVTAQAPASRQDQLVELERQVLALEVQVSILRAQLNAVRGGRVGSPPAESGTDATHHTSADDEQEEHQDPTGSIG